VTLPGENNKAYTCVKEDVIKLCEPGSVEIDSLVYALTDITPDNFYRGTVKSANKVQLSFVKIVFNALRGFHLIHIPPY
jgi:hypothetical protein